MTRRALHYVLKIGDRNKNIQFFRDLLGMKVLRHEEFHEMCQAQCNGPYDGKWSKTMIGYGPESENFVLELTYNYGIGNYKLGNDLLSIRIDSKFAYENISKQKDVFFMHKNPECIVLNSPDGYLFEVFKSDHPLDQPSLITKVSLSTTNVDRSKNYWHNLLGMNLHEGNDKHFIGSFGEQDARLEMVLIAGNQPIRHEKAYGRIAFACPESELSQIQERMLANKQTILTKLVSLDTPGKATVQVVILADPDGHEICFVGDEGFSKLSQMDPNANDLLKKAMETDKSNEWYAKSGAGKQKCE
ncbi:glyoxalase domain-containing protein 4 [Dermatophagoides pteronyssinus]|uniref:glyoxalase domain-containing protein 4 n=1 Tax=Dermatophagoides pteronyssinus TaxID=6956 RepID=UPI003F66B6C0